MAGNVRIENDNTKEVLEALGSALAAALEEAGIVCEGYAKKECPVDTGRLRNSSLITSQDDTAPKLESYKRREARGLITSQDDTAPKLSPSHSPFSDV